MIDIQKVVNIYCTQSAKFGDKYICEAITTICAINVSITPNTFLPPYSLFIYFSDKDTEHKVMLNRILSIQYSTIKYL